MTVEVVGYCDVFDKARGTGDITYFKEADRYRAPAPPSADDLAQYARTRGYPIPSGKPASTEKRLGAVYHYVPNDDTLSANAGEGEI